MNELLDASSLDAIEELADAAVPGTLLVFSCPLEDVASAAARSYGRLIIGNAAAVHDILTFAPEEGRWRVADLEPLQARVLNQPHSRHVLILENADQMDSRCHDRLLLLVEEPTSPTVVILCVPSAGLLPATLRGRSAAELVLSPPSIGDRVRALVEKGVSSAAAGVAVDLAGSLVSLALPIARCPELRAVAKKALNPDLDASRPVISAIQQVTRLDELSALTLAADTDPVAGSPVRQPPASQVNARNRALVRLWLEHRRRAVATAVQAGVPLGLVEAELDAQDQLLRRVQTPTNLRLAVAAFAVETPLPQLRVQARNRT